MRDGTVILLYRPGGGFTVPLGWPWGVGGSNQRRQKPMTPAGETTGQQGAGDSSNEATWYLQIIRNSQEQWMSATAATRQPAGEDGTPAASGRVGKNSFKDGGIPNATRHDKANRILNGLHFRLHATERTHDGASAEGDDCFAVRESVGQVRWRFISKDRRTMEFSPQVRPDAWVAHE